MILFVLLFTFVHLNNGFMLNMNIQSNYNWNNMQFSVKEIARNWFVNRATKLGIPWDSLYEKNVVAFDTLNSIKTNIENLDIQYPDYFLKPFHGYDKGNMIWKAAQEAEAATLSISATYWKDVNPFISQEWLRQNISENIHNYINYINCCGPKKILDVGCSVGISTEYLYDYFHTATSIDGIDLSPYFLSVAKYRLLENKKIISYQHANAENTSYPSNVFDLVVCNFLFHELPLQAANNVIKELYRILSFDGILAIVDMDPSHLDRQLNNNMFRKMAFESTEPHIYDYYLRNTEDMLKLHNFKNVRKMRNDPLNSLWIGQKKMNYFGSLSQYEKERKVEKQPITNLRKSYVSF